MKKRNLLKFLFGCIVIVFLFSYVMEYYGYYEYNLYNKKTLTEEQIERFEMDVKEGKMVDLNSYLTTDVKDYSNSLTRTTSQANLKLNDYLRKILMGSFDLLGKFIN